MLVLLDGEGFEAALPDVAAAPVTLAVAMHVGRQEPLHPGAEVVVAPRPEDEVEVIGHQTKADQPHRHAGAGLTEEPDEAMVVVGVVKDLGPAVATIEGVVAITTDRGSRRAGHGGIVAANGLAGKGIQGRRSGQGLVPAAGATGRTGQKNPECPRFLLCKGSPNSMKIDIKIVDRGRGPQLSTSRITVQDLLPYYREGTSNEEICRWIPSLTDEEIAVLKKYIRDHYEEVLKAEQEIKEYHDRMRASQPAWTRTTNHLSIDERRALLREKLLKRKAEENGADLSDG